MKIVSTKSVIKTWIVFHVFSLCFSSCSPSDDDEEPKVEQEQQQEKEFPVNVAINFDGVSWDNGEPEGGKDLTDANVIIKDQNRDPLVIDTKPKILSTGENNSIIAYIYLKYGDDTNRVETRKLENGDKFRVIAYKKTDGTYYCHKDYEVGKPYGKLQLVMGTEYTIVSYAFGGKILPDFSDLEKKNIDNAVVHFGKNGNPLLAFQRQDFIPGKEGSNRNVIEINLVAKVTPISLVFRSLGSGIPLEDTSFTMNSNTYFSEAKMDLKTGKFSCVSGCDKEEKIATTTGGGMDTSYNRQFFVFNEKKNISLDTKVRIFGSDEYFNDIYFYMPQGKKVTVYIDLRVCGAYTGSGKTNFKRFMCNDLGGEIINPNQTVVRNEQHGDFYIWGLKESVVSRQLFQEQPQNRSKWGFDWSDDSKKRIDIVGSFAGVCPNGWHIPTRKEWDGVVNNNRVGSVSGNKDLFSLGARIGENMIFPISGFIEADGVVHLPNKDVHKDSYAYRWAGDRLDSREKSGIMAKFRGGGAWVDYGFSLFRGYPLRCMKD